MNTELENSMVKIWSQDQQTEIARKGFIACSSCGSKVATSSKPYGGMLRFVCLNQECENSEGKAFN